ncbi:lamin tail domain-containing protein [Myxococcota bacterium]|nr:lamin tail domain-containing protein [Myxococcota bacterium]
MATRVRAAFYLLLGLTLLASCQCDQERLVQACAPEVCNRIDDDCDGDIDEGLAAITCGSGACQRTVEACVDGRPSECVPGDVTTEVCNGVDDDCNGLVDDGLGVARCGVGACARELASCSDGVASTCEPGPASPEICDGEDDDCDGQVDEGLLGDSCGVGACRRTVDLCGTSTVCEPGAPVDERCNGIDDDCDGEIDDGRCEAPRVACPVARTARVGDAVPLVGEVLSAGGPTRERWEVTTAPAGSRAAPEPPDQRVSSFVPDVAGEYTFELCAIDDDGLEACCTTTLVVSDCTSPPAPPAGTTCDTSWDGRPIVTFPPVATGLRYELVSVAGSTLAAASAGANWMRPSARIAPGGPPPGAAIALEVRACVEDDPACCSTPTPLVVNVVEACTTPIAAAPANVLLSEYVVDGEGSCNPPDCFVCEAGEAIEITNLSNCPVTLDGNHFKYQNASASSGSVRWMNFGAADVIPPRGVYVAIRGRNFAPTCSASLPPESSGLYGLEISTLAMEGNNVCSGWFNNTGGGLSEMQLAIGTVMSQADLDFATSVVLTRVAPYVTAADACVSTGFDALDSCGNVTGGATPAATLDPNQLGRLWHPCDAVVGATPACVRD